MNIVNGKVASSWHVFFQDVVFSPVAQGPKGLVSSPVRCPAGGTKDGGSGGSAGWWIQKAGHPVAMEATYPLLILPDNHECLY